MVIFLKAGGNLRTLLKPDIDYYTRRVVTEEGKTIKEILEDIGVNPALVAIIHTEGKGKGLNYVPSDGETLTLQPPVAGG